MAIWNPTVYRCLLVVLGLLGLQVVWWFKDTISGTHLHSSLWLSRTLLRSSISESVESIDHELEYGPAFEHDAAKATVSSECFCPESPNAVVCIEPEKTVQATQQIDDTHYLLVVIVLSVIHSKDRRDAIRNTWMKDYQEKESPVLVKFAIGTSGMSPSDLTTLAAEEETYHDLLLLHNLKDSYGNLARKVLYSFVWADRNLKFSYLMKCDDDTFLLLNLIVKELSSRTSKRGLYWGYFAGNQAPKKSGKWAEYSWFLCDYYLPYAFGGGYIISADLIHRLSITADGLQLYRSEDVSVGAWLGPYAAERKHDQRFDTEWASRGCKNYHLVSHKQSIKMMHSKSQNLRTKGVQCGREYQVRSSHGYNWKASPSHCCKH